MTTSGQRVIRLAVGILWLAAIVLYALPSHNVAAATLTSRSLTLQTGAGGDGGSMPSGVVNHLYSFTVPTTGDVGSIEFEYCTTATGTCTTPAGLNTDGAGVTLGDQQGAVGFTLNKTTNGAPYLTRTAAEIPTSQAVTYRLDGVTNPSAVNTTFYVRITTYLSEDTTGGSTDTGTVAASTATQIQLSGYMPESLVFCTGGTVGTTNGVPDCSTATSGSLTFPDFSTTVTSFIASQMAASTNADNGYSITYSGATLTSGSNTITPMSSATTSVIGTSQFGLNLMDNATPNIGTSVTPATNGTNYKGQPVGDYGTADTFKFTTSGESVAQSNNGGAGPTDSQIFTVSYIVNANGAQPVGTYTTTLTYVCTATY